MQQQFMQRAIELAYENVRDKGEPYGAVVVRNGAIVGSGVNEVHRTGDPTAHSEIQAIREACKKLGTVDLSDCEMYASGEPCPMCMATIYWTGFRVVYYAYPKVPEEEVRGSAYIYEQLSLPLGERDISIIRVENEDPEKDPYVLFERMQS